jgi:hypothetical protein
VNLRIVKVYASIYLIIAIKSLQYFVRSNQNRSEHLCANGEDGRKHTDSVPSGVGTGVNKDFFSNLTFHIKTVFCGKLEL